MSGGGGVECSLGTYGEGWFNRSLITTACSLTNRDLI